MDTNPTPTPDLAQRARALWDAIDVAPCYANTLPLILAALADVERETVEACAKAVCVVCAGKGAPYLPEPSAFRRTYQHFTANRKGWAWCNAAALYREFGFPGEAGKGDEESREGKHEFEGGLYRKTAPYCQYGERACLREEDDPIHFTNGGRSE